MKVRTKISTLNVYPILCKCKYLDYIYNNDLALFLDFSTSLWVLLYFIESPSLWVFSFSLTLLVEKRCGDIFK